MVTPGKSVQRGEEVPIRGSTRSTGSVLPGWAVSVKQKPAKNSRVELTNLFMAGCGLSLLLNFKNFSLSLSLGGLT
jgi:hypothetical protein